MLLHGMPQVSVLDDNGKVVSVREYLDQIEKTTNAGTDWPTKVTVRLRCSLI